MKARQYKKLCKKAAEALNFNNCEIEDGIWFVYWDCGGYEQEWDSEDAWPWLETSFSANVNTVVDYDSECGISWKPESRCLKATPRNVFNWYRNEKANP